MFLRQSTASQEVLLGPFVDSTDGNTVETGLTIANTDIKVFKAGATTLANKNSGGATHISGGNYYAVLDATDTDTLGNLELVVQVSGALAVRRTYTVLPALVYDSFVVGGPSFPLFGIIHSGTGQAATGTTFRLDAAAAFADDTVIGGTLLGYGATQGYWQARSVTDNALTNDVMTVDTWTVTPSGTLSYVLFAGGPASTSLLPAVNVEQWKGATAPAMTGDAFARLGAPAGASVSADIAAIEAQTDDIGTAGAGLTGIPWNAAWDTEVQSEVTDALNAYDPPTNTEMEARTIVAANYATAANLATVDTVVDAIKAKTDSLTFTVSNVLDTNMVCVEGNTTIDGLSLDVLLQRIHAAFWAKRSGLDGTTPDTVTVRNFADNGNLGTITIDENGNVTAST